MAPAIRQAEAESPDDGESPAITSCESAPGRTVFLEAENTDGWIASDTTVAVTR